MFHRLLDPRGSWGSKLTLKEGNFGELRPSRCRSKGYVLYMKGTCDRRRDQFKNNDFSRRSFGYLETRGFFSCFFCCFGASNGRLCGVSGRWLAP